MTISRAEWEELSQMKTLMRDVVQRLAVVERVQKRASTSDEGGVPAKTKKLSLPSSSTIGGVVALLSQTRDKEQNRS